MKIKDVDGSMVEATPLILQKKYAKEILAGTKTVEFREMKEYYQRKFYSHKIAKENETCAPEDWKTPMKTIDDPFIHFYTYNNSFHLDVLVDYSGIIKLTKEDSDFLIRKFGCHEIENEWQQFVDVPEDEVPQFFYFHIGEIISHHGLED